MPLQNCLSGAPSTMLTMVLLAIFGVISIILGAVAWTRSTSLYLPLPAALPATGTLLPILTVLVPAINTLYNRSTAKSKSRNAPPSSGITQTIFVPFIHALLLILPTIVLTLSVTYLVPSDTQDCGLERTWQAYFHNKNAPAIRTIQDTLQCCGLRSTRDRAWPFKDGKRYKDDACELNLGYSRSCLAVWGGEERKIAGLMVGSVVVVFVMKILLYYSITSQARLPWSDSLVVNASSEIEGQRGSGDLPRIRYTDSVPDDSTVGENHHSDEEDPGARTSGRPRLGWTGANVDSDQDRWRQEDSASKGTNGDDQDGSNGPAVHPSGLGGARPLLD